MTDRCSTRCDHDSQCALPGDHEPADRHETDHGCICYDPRRYGPFARENRKDDELRFAPHGASAAACAVCGWESMKRVAEGDGFVPICSTFCLQAWPRVRDLLDRAESAELGCEIAYRREPTQAEGDAHEYRHDQSMGASESIRECHVSMGNHHGHRCSCGRWVWGGPTVCQRCVDAEALKAALERRSAHMYAKAWEREIGPPYVEKTHHIIDSLVVTTRARIEAPADARAEVERPTRERDEARANRAESAELGYEIAYSPADVRAEVERLTRERDEARDEAGRLSREEAVVDGTERG